MDNITIARQLPLTRIVDYQPTAKLEPTTLNQDANYLMEVIKDRKDEIDDLFSEYSDIANKESTNVLLARISELRQEIATLGDISTLRTNVTTNRNNITTLKNYDYVIETQDPTAENNYTWYRKYKSGWIEQGGHTTSSDAGTICSFPVEMRDTNYSALVSVTGDSSSNFSTAVKTKQTNYITISNYTEARPCDWVIFGFTAA